jgi:hypothetical protein
MKKRNISLEILKELLIIDQDEFDYQKFFIKNIELRLIYPDVSSIFIDIKDILITSNNSYVDLSGY